MKWSIAAGLMAFSSLFGAVNVGVFCGADETIPEVYKKEAFELGKALGTAGYGLVTGGSNTGLMNTVVNGFAAAAAPQLTHGILPSLFRNYNVKHPAIPDENVVWTEGVYPRLQTFHEKCDAVVVLPGGFGTLHEMMDFMVCKQWGLSKKKVVLVNADHYWDHLLLQFKHMVKTNTLKQKHLDLLTVVTSLDECMAALTDETSTHAGLTDHYWEKK